MKEKMYHITHQRNRDFMNQYRRSAKSLRLRGLKPTREEIVLHALTQPAPSYYADFYRATSILGRPGRGDKIKHRYASSRQWKDMAADLARLRAARPRKRVNDIILDLLTGRAGHPRFYLTPRRAMQIVADNLHN